MEFRLACPNGQWLAGKEKAVEAMKKLGSLGFQFEIVHRGGAEFVRVSNEVKIDIKSIEQLVHLQSELDAPLMFFRGAFVISEL